MGPLLRPPSSIITGRGDDRRLLPASSAPQTDDSKHVASLLEAQRRSALAARLQFYGKHALLVLDEVGYLPLAPGGPNLLFQLGRASFTLNNVIGLGCAIAGDGVRSAPRGHGGLR